METVGGTIGRLDLYYRETGGGTIGRMEGVL